MNRSNILLHIPHSSKDIPDEFRSQFLLSDEEINHENNLMTDHFTDWLLAPLGIPIKNQIISPVSRLIVDMERFNDDSLEVMANIGMGVVYKKGSQLQTIRRELSGMERRALIKQYYNPHHQKLEALTESTLQTYGQTIIIDVHSYPKVALPYEQDNFRQRPEICIGTCEYHTPKKLEACLVDSFISAGFEVDLNTPFAGTLIPSKYWNKEKRVLGFMLEVRRDVYMDENSFTLAKHSDDARNKICQTVEQALSTFYSMED